MQAIKVHAHIGHDGLLKLEVPVGVADQDVEAVVVLNTASSDELAVPIDENGYPVNFFEAIDSIQSDDLLERPSQGGTDVREPIE